MKVLILVIGAVLGSLIGRLSKGIRFLDWLSFGDSFGLKATTLDLGLFDITLGFHLEITIAANLGLILAIFCCRKLR